MGALWKCLVEGCKFTAPPTAKGYKQMTGHMLGHASKGLSKEKRKYALVDEDTGEVLANKITEAKEKGLLIAEGGVEPPASSELTPGEKLPGGKEGEEKPKGKEQKKEPEITSEGIFAYTIHLPADAFTMFNLAKFSGLEKDGDKPFDEWIWDCILARFHYDYERELVLAPVPEERKRR